MNNPTLKMARGSGRTHRRFAHLTVDDVAALDAIAAVRGVPAAREYERLIRAQHRDELEHRERCPLSTDAAPGAVDLLRDAARYSHGPGGGRRRPTREAQA